MGFVVKNTTNWSFLDLISPHTCRGCGQVGSVLCSCCKNNLKVGGLHEKPKYAIGFDKFLICSKREGLIGEIIKEYKYNSVRDFGKILADFLLTMIEKEFEVGATVIVPLPTIKKHIRARGFDHMEEVSRWIKKRDWRTQKVLRRINASVQVGASAELRQKQAQMAYGLKRGVKIEKEKNYLLIDDVCTTGASLMAAAEILRDNGAIKISVAVVAWSGKD